MFSCKTPNTKVPISSSQILSSSNPFRDVFGLQPLAQLNKAWEMRDRLLRSLVLFLTLKEQNWTEPKNSLKWLGIYLCVELPKHKLKAEYFQNLQCKWRPLLKPSPLSLETFTKDLFFFYFCYNQQDNYHKSIYLPSSPLFFFQHWHTNHAILTSFLFSQFFWNILFSTVNSFGEVPCWSSTVYNVNCVSASSWGLASHQHLLIKQFEFLSLRS